MEDQESKTVVDHADDIFSDIKDAIAVGASAYETGKMLGEHLDNLEHALRTDHGISVIDLLKVVAHQFHGIKF